MDFYINFYGKISLSSLTLMWTTLFCIVLRQNIFCLKKSVKWNPKTKKFGCVIWFWVMTNTWMVEIYTSYPNTRGGRDIHHVPFSSYLWNSLNIVRYFDRMMNIHMVKIYTSYLNIRGGLDIHHIPLSSYLLKKWFWHH